MFSRIFLTPIRHYCSLTRNMTYFSQSHLISHQKDPIFGPTRLILRHFGTENDGNAPNGEKPSSDLWKLTQDSDTFGSLFGKNDVGIDGVKKGGGDVAEDDWLKMRPEVETWDLKEDVLGEDVFDVGDVRMVDGGNEVVADDKVNEKSEDDLVLQQEEEALLAVLKGPTRTFGILVAASGITDAMLDSLIVLKDFQNIDGLPPLMEIEDKRYEDSLKKSSRYEMELQKQEEDAKSRVRQVDEKGRSYATGRRKCSIAQVWIQPGEGKVLVNDKESDVYFPLLDHRAALLRPLSETQTLGLWDVKCNVKGGGVSGQVGAIQLGISRALQNWEPGLRPPLRDAGFLTRDSRVVERKKPGKAKARKSFQWVKR